jgi:ribokinase
MNLDIICFGALNLDRLYMVSRIAGEGEESFILDCKETPGGSAANTAVGVARLQLKTGYIGKVAEDREGKILLQALEDENIHTAGVIVSGRGRSGTVTGFIDKKGERSLYVDPGVNDSLTFKEIDLEYANSTDIMHFTSFVGEKPFNAQKRLVGKLSNVKVSFDPGDLYARKGLASLRPIIKNCHITLPNESEIKLLTKENYRQGSKVLLKEGVEIVAVKLGERGCYVTDGKESHLIKPFRVKVRDCTGAGDAFCAGFLYGLAKNKDLYECGRLGNFVASCCVRKVGARTGMPKPKDLHKIV